ncbi:MAG TPA: HAD-IC family P-type ATPase, partial [Candidatus Limnocylindrales bacterium]|nr:HAD-IC family P-type ATPase [Candidatus Limnocylindrales bacterium]
MPWDAPPDAHAVPAAAVAATLDVDPSLGLTLEEARRRAEATGANALEAEARPGILRMIVGAASEPFVLLLLAAGLGAVALGEVRDGVLVLLGLIPIVGADVATEYRGDRALEALRAASAPRARVRRDGTADEIDAAGIVPGDVVLLRVGDVVPADLRLTRAERLVLDRSVLTGESVPEPAVVEPDPPQTELADRRSMAYSGTSVVGGRGEGVVVTIGAGTEVGRIAGGLSGRQRRRSPLQLELDRLVRILLVVAIGLIAITSGLGFLRGNPIGANLLAGISAAIAAIPEEPPVLLAVVLGLGAYRLLNRGVLVRRLNAEEVLGAVDLVVTDKTGTLTENRLEVTSVGDLGGPIADDGRCTVLLERALRAEDDAWAHREGIGTSSFTRALARAVDAAGGNARPDPADLIEATPVDDGRPYATTTARSTVGIETLVLGAPEAVADLALGSDGDERARWHAAIEAGTAAGQRVVGLARRVDDGSWSMEALIGFADPLRAGIVEATSAARQAGIQVTLVTGDHPTTARAIAAQAGLADGRIVTGAELDRWNDA